MDLADSGRAGGKPSRQRISRRLSVFVIWGFLGCCALFALAPKLMPLAPNPDPGSGLTSLVDINSARGIPGCYCYTYPWLANAYESLRVGILWGLVPLVLALIVLYLTKPPRAKA